MTKVLKLRNTRAKLQIRVIKIKEVGKFEYVGNVFTEDMNATLKPEGALE